jgi:MFS transporter, PHS family, inorganic phosphate transporter
MVGLVILSIIFIVIDFGCHKLAEHHGARLALFVLARFFSFGPNVTTFIAQVVFGTLWTPRAASNATAAAHSPWLNHLVDFFGLFMLCGYITALLIPKTEKQTLEDLAGDPPGTANCDP